MTNTVDLATRLNATTASNLKKNGILYVGRYLSDSSWKGMHPDEVQAIKEAGLDIFSIYENGSTETSHFTVSQGKADAITAVEFAKALGQPAGSAIYFTVDFDAQEKDFSAILAYFESVKTNLQGYELGAYGSYSVLNYLHSKGVPKYYFQTVAWSRGQRNSFLHIYQSECDQTFAGLNVDFDILEQNDIGAWVAKAAQTAPKTAVKAASTTKLAAKQAPKPKTYTVVAGDTLSGIASKFGVSEDSLAKLNNISDPNLIKIGEVLKLAVIPEPVYYMVVPGDSLSKIASQHGTTVSALVTLNKLKDPDVIYVGQKLRIK